MKFMPHKYQTEAIRKIECEKAAGLFLDMGLGKTVITLTAISDLIALDEVRKVLVIAPLQTAINTWSTEAEKWDHTRGLRISLVVGSAAKRKKALKADADIYVLNRENTQWFCELDPDDWPFYIDMLVIDELSSFKNPSAKRFKALRKYRAGIKRVVGLTGTPAPNGYMDLWSEVYLLYRGARLEQTIGRYRMLYFTPGQTNGHVVYNWRLRPGAKEVIDRKLSDLCISMKAEDWLEMPENVRTEVFVSMTDEEKKLYDEFGREHVLPAEGIVGRTAAAVQNKLLQMANGFAYTEEGDAFFIHDHKIEALKEIVEAGNGKNLLVYYSFVADKQRLLDHFPYAVELKGADEVRKWNEGRIPMLIAHPASAGHGLNLQYGGSTVVWFGLPWSLELYLQANARLYRQGQKETVFVYHILTKGTHDIDVLHALQRKDTTQEALLSALKAQIRGWTK